MSSFVLGQRPLKFRLWILEWVTVTRAHLGHAVFSPIEQIEQKAQPSKYLTQILQLKSDASENSSRGPPWLLTAFCMVSVYLEDY